MTRPPTKPCSAAACNELIARRMLMCSRHWRMVPRDIQDRVYITFQQWQTGDGSARDYAHAVAQAQLAVANKEGLSGAILAQLEADVARFAPPKQP